MANGGSDGSLSQEDIDALLSGEVNDQDAGLGGGDDIFGGGDDILGGDSDGLLDDNALADFSDIMGGGDSSPSTPSAPASKPKKTGRGPGSHELDNPENMELLLDVKLNLSVEIGRTKMQVEEVLNLGSGAIVELDKLNGEPVDILVNNRLVARGKVVAVDENFGVEIGQIIDPEERFKIEM